MMTAPTSAKVLIAAFAFLGTTSAATCVYALTAVRAVRDASITAVEAVRDEAIAPIAALKESIVAAGDVARAADAKALAAQHAAELNEAVMFKTDAATTLIVELTKLTGAVASLTQRVGDLDVQLRDHARQCEKARE